ncbi:phosphatidylinositol-binding protein scs2 [Agyrium rufum]|nr:phosphatidylinositol-binding protein scs2 [Agyrium rufum]
MKEDPPLEAKCRDKFLVQSVGIPADADANVASIWSNIEKTNKSSIQERKIRVSFLPSHDSSTGASASNTPQHHSVNGALASSQMSDHDGPPPAYNSPPSQNYGSPASSSTKAAPPDREAPSAPFSTAKDPAASSSTGSATTTAGVISNSVSNAASATQQTLQQQLENAKAQIAALQKSATESGASLKQRAVGGDERSGGRALAQAPGQAAAEGVPVQIVAALCLLSFLLAYFLF